MRNSKLREKKLNCEKVAIIFILFFISFYIFIIIFLQSENYEIKSLNSVSLWDFCFLFFFSNLFFLSSFSFSYTLEITVPLLTVVVLYVVNLKQYFVFFYSVAELSFHRAQTWHDRSRLLQKKYTSIYIYILNMRPARWPAQPSYM